MIYIYDILVNFNDTYLFDFFEWNFSDSIENLKKVKLYRVSSEDMDHFYRSKIRISSSFLDEIYKSCEVYTKNNVKILPYVNLFSDGTRTIAIEWSQHGISEAKSKLILEEEEDIFEVIEDLEISSFPYEILEEEKNHFFITRKELKIKKYLINEIEDAFHEKNDQKIKFLYEEYFEKEATNIQSMKEELISSMEYFLDDKHWTLYELLKLSHKKKQV